VVRGVVRGVPAVNGDTTAARGEVGGDMTAVRLTLFVFQDLMHEGHK